MSGGVSIYMGFIQRRERISAFPTETDNEFQGIRKPCTNKKTLLIQLKKYFSYSRKWNPIGVGIILGLSLQIVKIYQSTVMHFSPGQTPNSGVLYRLEIL
jgi:hypothetical protein